MELSLLVIRVSDINRSKAFYELFGLVFLSEQHGTGPKHYSTQIEDAVLELYPATAKHSISSSTRLGFKLDGLKIEKSSVETAGGSILSATANTAVIADPDGIKIEISNCKI